MAVYISSLNSGSNGNCYYIGNDHEAVLIDAGISCKETEKRMARLSLDINSVKAIFISHEHTDHVKGLNSLAEKYNLEVYMTSATAKQLDINKFVVVKEFVSFQQVFIGELCITSFPKFHDAVDPHSFIISHLSNTIGVFTDIGRLCDRVKKYFTMCTAAFLECNYDDEMLTNGKYPQFLKNRIKGGNGHLSNDQALQIFQDHRAPFLSHLFLSHVSKDNNCPIKSVQLFKSHSKGTEIVLASRYEPTPVYHLEDHKIEILPKAIQKPTGIGLKYNSTQLSMFN